MENSLKNMVLTLFIITLIAATSAGMAYRVTKEPIALAKVAKTISALTQVLPSFDNDPAAEKQTLDIDGITVTVYTAKSGEETVGYAVKSATKKGFSGEIHLLLGFLPDGKIHNIQVLQHTETPGLGSKITNPNSALVVMFRGNSPADLQMSVRKDGGDINAISGATISSRAYIDAVERGYKAMRIISEKSIP